MLSLTPKSVIYVARSAIDFRKGTDGIIAICKQVLCLDPFSGALFVFYNKRRTAVKILFFDGQGYWLCNKRLSVGRFKGKFALPNEGNCLYTKICYRAMHILINNGDPDSANLGKDWRPLSS